MIKNKWLEIIQSHKKDLIEMQDEIEVAKGLNLDKKNDLREQVKTSLLAFEDAEQSLIFDDSDEYFMIPLTVAISIYGSVWGQLKEVKDFSKRMSDYGKLRSANSKKQWALDQIKAEFEEQKDQFKRYGYTALFVRNMLQKYPIIESPKTIEKLVSKLKKNHPLS